MYSKGEVVDYLLQYSKYYDDLLGFCNIISEEVNPHSALINLFNITEIVFKSKLDNYDINFYAIIEKLEKEF